MKPYIPSFESIYPKGEAAMITRLVVRNSVASRGPCAAHLSIGIGQERRAACVSKEIYTADDRQLTNLVGPVAHTFPGLSIDDLGVSRPRCHQ